MKSKYKLLWSILLLGAVVRFLFYFFGAEIYYGKEQFYISGDTFWWLKNIINLIEHGSYTDDLNNKLGYFTRTPGYSFFLGFFYLLAGKNIELSLKMAVIVQIVLDIVAVFLTYKISIKIFKNTSVALIASALYALYPFVIVWNVIAYAESLSVFLFIWSIYLFLHAEHSKNYFFSGVIFSLSILTRVQMIVFIPFFIAIAIIRNINKKQFKWINSNVLAFVLAIVLVYGSWPLRNMVIHGKPILAQHLGDRKHWSSDYIYYRKYIWSVKTGYEPQHTQIIKGEKVEFPPASYAYPGDSVLLENVVELARTCGEGFSYFARSAGYRDTVVIRGNDCNDQIVDIFKTLIKHQKRHNTLNHYVLVPLSNLKKAVFKFDLNKPVNNNVAIFANVLFVYRTILILIAALGIIFIFIKHRQLFFSPGILIITGYSISWYLFQSFIYRHMEIRYLLHADILLLLPASYILYVLFSKFRKL